MPIWIPRGAEHGSTPRRIPGVRVMAATLMLICYQLTNDAYRSRNLSGRLCPRRHALSSAGFLPRCIVGLATSLEIKWRFDLFSDSADRVCTEHRRRFTQSLELLPQASPGLSRLTLAFEDRLYYKRLRPSDNMAEVESILLKPLLSAATSLKLRSFDVEVPHSLFDEFRLVGNMECGVIPEGSK